MQHKTASLIATILGFFPCVFKTTIVRIVPLMDAGSMRRHFRIYAENGQSYIATYDENTLDRERLLGLTNLFKKADIPCPTILYIHRDSRFFVQEDNGAMDLLTYKLRYGLNRDVKKTYEKSVENLALLHARMRKKTKVSIGIGLQKNMEKEWMISDGFAFKNYFLDPFQSPYILESLVADFYAMRDCVVGLCEQYPSFVGFMYRDFQARNILVAPDKGPVFIDYQGAFTGVSIYDLASLLCQVRAALPSHFQAALYTRYCRTFEKVTSLSLPTQETNTLFLHCLLLRYLQILGAYGNRGMIEGKAYFLQNIPLALKAIRQFLKAHKKIRNAYPALSTVLDSLPRNPMLRSVLKEIPALDTRPILRVRVQSFSYKKGIPKDYTGNGGGFVWDCRFLPNPGREESYKTKTGKDPEVVSFFEKEKSMHNFLAQLLPVVQRSVDRYKERNYKDISFSFGCTGGQHRSVYAAEWLSEELRAKYGNSLEVECVHREAR